MGALRTSRSGWLLAGLAALALGACGHTEVVGAGRTVQIVVTEYRLTPQRVSVPAGELTLVVRNLGRLAHNLAVSQGGRITAQTRPIQPGASASLTLEVASGSYVMASTLFDDQSLGAYGSLIVSR